VAAIVALIGWTGSFGGILSINPDPGRRASRAPGATALSTGC